MCAISRFAVAAVVATVCCASSLFAADQTLLGRQFLLRDPSLGVSTLKRTIKVTGREKASANTLLGDSTPPGSGGTIAVFLNGSTSPSFSAVLQQGTSPSGTAYWRGAASSQFQYTDSKGVNGPVKKVKIKRSANGTFTAQVQMSGKHGLLPAPSTPGTSACVALTLGFDPATERYSLLFGSESELTNEPDRLFEAKNPTVEGVCPSITCSGTGYPTCGGTCGPGEVCRPLSGHPATFDPTGFCACVAEAGPTDCPAGSAYQTGGDQNDIPIGCSPIPTCNDIQSTGYPSCAGGVAPGAVCQPLRVLDFTLQIDASVCVPYPAAESCQSFCSLSGGGVCPGGEVCAVSSSGGEGMDCGCFTPPFCIESGTCGGGCPDGTCITCPPELCGPTPVCLCSND